ncbi:alpha/beta fold hydrolase [Marivita sp. S2033]|uniref:alpha/beta fold hydrolase n=1 Tax=Marivita sp. S2033 TaxID=3373187 RepID=UPI0039827A11
MGVKAGFPVYWRTFGDGEEPALLLHCGLAHSGAWARLAALLADRLTMIAPDMPGHGHSGDWDPAYDLHDQITAIARDCLGQGGHVIGHSFGATVALRLAIEMPERVCSLTLIEPVLFAAAKESDPMVFQRYLETMQGVNHAMDREDWAEAARLFTALWGDGRSWDTLSDKERRTFAEQVPFVRQTEGHLEDDGAGLLDAGRLEGIACPVMLLRGAETLPIISAVHATLQRRIPVAHEHVIGGAGHMAPITHPEPVARRIKALLDAAPPCKTAGGAPFTEAMRR